MNMWENVLRVLKVCKGEIVLGKEMQKEKIAGVLRSKKAVRGNTCFYKADKRKITYSAGRYKTEIDFVLVGEKYRKCVRDVKVIPWELQYILVVVDRDKKVLKKL